MTEQLESEDSQIEQFIDRYLSAIVIIAIVIGVAGLLSLAFAPAM